MKRLLLLAAGAVEAMICLAGGADRLSYRKPDGTAVSREITVPNR